MEQSATKASDEIYGFDTDDVLRGAGGNDLLFGGPGFDTYRYNKGDGSDTLIDWGDAPGNVDRLEISSNAGLTSTKARLNLTNGIELSFSGRKEKFVLSGVEAITFSDGVTLPVGSIQGTYLNQTISKGQNSILGFSSANGIGSGLSSNTLGDMAPVYTHFV